MSIPVGMRCVSQIGWGVVACNVNATDNIRGGRSPPAVALKSKQRTKWRFWSELCNKNGKVAGKYTLRNIPSCAIPLVSFTHQQQRTCGAVGGSPMECGVGGQAHKTPHSHPQHRHPPPGVTLPRRACVRLNRLRTGVGRFRSCLYKWGMASSEACQCGAEEQTVDHVVLQCPIHRPPHGLHGLTVPDDETIKWLLNTCPEIQCGQAVIWTTSSKEETSSTYFYWTRTLCLFDFRCLQTFLSEDHISCSTKVRGPDILRNGIVLGYIAFC